MITSKTLHRLFDSCEARTRWISNYKSMKLLTFNAKYRRSGLRYVADGFALKRSSSSWRTASPPWKMFLNESICKMASILTEAIFLRRCLTVPEFHNPPMWKKRWWKVLLVHLLVLFSLFHMERARRRGPKAPSRQAIACEKDLSTKERAVISGWVRSGLLLCNRTFREEHKRLRFSNTFVSPWEL